MLRGSRNFVAGLMTGLLATGLLLLLISEPRGKPVELLPAPTRAPLQVHVAGAVYHPGVYELPVHSLVKDAIEAAGGPLEDAILDMVNMASPIEDGQQIFLPSMEDTPTSNITSSQPITSIPGARININTASASELEALPGIGPSLAKKITQYRETYGPFITPEDLVKVSGIGPAKLELILDLITLR